MITYSELTNTAKDKELLKNFYQEIYIPEFPDDNERESLENIEKYLSLKEQGWYGKNNYHVIVATNNNEIIAGTISDFLAEANTGVIEFLVVSQRFRQGGIGKAILTFTESLLKNDAQESLKANIDCIVCEMNDPYQPSHIEDNINPIQRTLIWHKWGYSGLGFPYIQPALSQNQVAVNNLLFIAKIFRSDWQKFIPSQQVQSIVSEYYRWAMRIENPQEIPEYKETLHFLSLKSNVTVFSLAHYVGCDVTKPMNISEIFSTSDDDFLEVMSIYQRAFPPGSLVIEPQDFAKILSAPRNSLVNYTYHLWAIRESAESAIEGMASFFSFPLSGFGGYIAFEGSLNGTWRSRLLVARIEQAMIQDQKSENIEGWYIETALTQPKGLFRRLGFYEIDVSYEQPPLVADQKGSRARLWYKPFGRVYTQPKIKKNIFLKAIYQIFQVVYEIDNPDKNLSYLFLKEQIYSQNIPLLLFKA